jgi:hypothetical protein
MGGGGGAPALPDYYQMTSGELTAKSNLAPSVYATEAQFDPQYTNLGVSNLSSAVLGTPASSRQVPVTTTKNVFRNTQTGELSDTLPAWNPGGVGIDRSGGSAGLLNQTNPWVPYQLQNTDYNTVTTPAAPGLLDLTSRVSSGADAIAAASGTRQRTAQIGDVSNLGPDAINALMTQDPWTAMLMQQLTGQASGDLSFGSNLTPAQMRLVQQSVRQGQAARGMGYGPSDVYGEALGVSQFGNQLLQQRIGTAQSVAQQRQQLYGAPALALTTQPAAPNYQPYLSGGAGITGSIGPKLFGTDFNASDVANAGFNAQNARYISGQNNAAALTGAGISGAALIGAAALGL